MLPRGDDSTLWGILEGKFIKGLQEASGVDDGLVLSDDDDDDGAMFLIDGPTLSLLLLGSMSL